MARNSRPLNEQAVQLASWGTPRCVESGHSSGNPERAMDSKSRLEDQVFLADSGETPTGSTAGTASIGQLNPAMSRFLMGLPPVWDELAPMPQTIKPTPIKYCVQCGMKLERKRFNGVLEGLSIFKKRKYCNQECMAAAQEGTMKVLSLKNSRRQSAKAAGTNCEMCSRPGTETRLHVHHQDKNPLNNDPLNLRTLCGSCHHRCHSPNFTETGEQRRTCEFCDKPSMKRGWCYTHMSRFKRFGHPLAKKRKIGSEWVLMLHDGSSWSPFQLWVEPNQESVDFALTATLSSHK
jgi:hypothetical protein